MNEHAQGFVVLRAGVLLRTGRVAKTNGVHDASSDTVDRDGDHACQYNDHHAYILARWSSSRAISVIHHAHDGDHNAIDRPFEFGHKRVNVWSWWLVGRP